mgnify:CR=1 FL=1
MVTRKGKAVWQGSVKEGSGVLSVESGAFEAKYSFGSRFEDGPGTNPEEIIGAAHAGCFSMALSLILGEAGYTPTKIETSAQVKIHSVDGHFEIPSIHLDCTATVPGLSKDEFATLATKAKEGCPVSKALAGPEITMKAQLK